MRRRTSVWISGFFMIFSGCATGPPPVYQDPSLLIRIETNPAVSGQLPLGGNAHSLSTEQFGGVLRGAYVRKKQGLFDYVIGGSQTQPVFPEENFSIIASELLKGLRLAKSDERVAFQVWRTGKKGLRDETSGAMYLRGNLLYVSVDKYRISQRMSYEGAEGGSGKDFDLFFEPSAAVVERQKGFSSRWLGADKPEVIIDLTRVSAAAPLSLSTDTSPSPVAERALYDLPSSSGPATAQGEHTGISNGDAIQELRRQISELTQLNQELQKASSAQETELEGLRKELAETKQALGDKVLEVNRLKTKSKGKQPAASSR
ncbi:MAG TPA: hypothetical protein VGJ57_03125 [Nitrospirales bacterium]|jgi:hypothetical protein